MKRYNLGDIKWTVAGFVPEYWRITNCTEIGVSSDAEVPAVKAPVPGSVQKALLDAGIIQDWKVGLNSRLCEWVENRHWIYETSLPDEWFEENRSYKLKCLGLDYCGCIRLNGEEIYRFANAHIPHVIDLTPHLKSAINTLQVILECPPRWQGQFGFTSRFTSWKPRFNYFWDWTIRMVQVGIWDDIFIESIDDKNEIGDLKIDVDANVEKQSGILEISGKLPENDNLHLAVSLKDGEKTLIEQCISTEDFNKSGLRFQDLNVSFWWPNCMGEQKLYKLVLELKDGNVTTHDIQENDIGFRNVKWEKCLDAPDEADPWICVVNGKSVFLFGVNWTPIRTNFADVKPDDYEKRLSCYMNMNMLRVWGGGFLERKCFYDICDRLGIMVWQEFPLSSSGVENYPPDSPDAIAELSEIAKSFITRRRHHPSLLLWSGGNELADDKDGQKNPWYQPIGMEHPLIKEFARIVKTEDGNRRFIATSPSGPRGHGTSKEFGKGLHWDVHRPWKIQGSNMEENIRYWNNDDALLRSETGAPGPASAELIRRFKGELAEFPANAENELWNRSPWWLEWENFMKEKGREPENLEEYVQWGQQRQADALCIALSSARKRFPKCGGFLIWMGHDCYPCAANTSILDFEGNPKPAALRIAELIAQYNEN